MHALIFHTCGKTPELSQRERFHIQNEPSNRVPQRNCQLSGPMPHHKSTTELGRYSIISYRLTIRGKRAAAQKPSHHIPSYDAKVGYGSSQLCADWAARLTDDHCCLLVPLSVEAFARDTASHLTMS
uniref:Uncharacterized protein n=1 Tax=Bionectria ochroleuca TaxID=29856 RepID=A0A8H7TUR9_BIOOC